MGKIALNEWPLSGTQIGTPNVRVWAGADISSSHKWQVSRQPRPCRRLTKMRSSGCRKCPFGKEADTIHICDSEQ